MVSQRGREVRRVSGWMEGFQRSIDYMEENLAGELDIREIARRMSHPLKKRTKAVFAEPRNP